MKDTGTIALVQEAPQFLNLKESIARAVDAIERAADQGASIIGFAECWAPGYPVWLDYAPRAAMWDDPGAKQLFRLLGDNSVVQGDDHIAAIQNVPNKTGTTVVLVHMNATATRFTTPPSPARLAGTPCPIASWSLLTPNA